MVRKILALHFPPSAFRWSVILQSCIFSRPLYPAMDIFGHRAKFDSSRHVDVPSENYTITSW